MAVPSLDDLLAELDRQDELDAVEPTVEAAAIETIPEVQPEAKQEQQEGGSSGSVAVRRRRGGRFSDMMGSSGGAKPETGESQRMSTKAVDDCDASTRDDERSPTWRALGQVAQEHHRSEFGHSSSSEEAEGSRVTDLLLQDAEVDPERQRAQVEAAAFEERQRKAREEAEERAKEEERRNLEAAREAWERHQMAQEEAEERRVRANRYASVLEDKTRKLVEKQSSKRKKLREDEREQRQKEKDKRKEEKMRSEAARMSEKIRKMAENGYALGPSGWVRMDWLSAPAEIGDPNYQVVQGPVTREEEEEPPDEDASDEEPNDPFEVVDQRPLPDEEQAAPEAVPFEDVLAELDKKQMESIAAGAQAADLETVLDIVAADEERDLAAATAVEVRQGYEKLGEVEEEQDDVPQDATETATNVLRVAKTRRPDAKFGQAINEESALKPFNDFMEEKQEGSNSYEERQARSAAIQAKLQAARNRMSIVRYERNNERTRAPAPPVQEKRSPAKAKPQPKMPSRQEDRRRPAQAQAGWGWLQSG